jgi:hypothetical protein
MDAELEAILVAALIMVGWVGLCWLLFGRRK